MIVKSSEYKTKFSKMPENILGIIWIIMFSSGPMLLFKLVDWFLFTTTGKNETSTVVLITILVYICIAIVLLVIWTKRYHSSFQHEENLLEEIENINKKDRNFYNLNRKREILQELQIIDNYGTQLEKYQQQEKEIESKIQELRNTGNISTEEKIYDIAINLWEKYLEKIPKTRNFKIERFQHIIDKKAIFITIYITLILLYFFPQNFIIISIFSFLFILPFIRMFMPFYDYIEKYNFSLPKTTYIRKQVQEFYSLAKTEQNHLPHLSLLFGDIITIFTENISKRQKLLAKIRKDFQFIRLPIIFIHNFIKIPLSEENENFLKNENQKIIDDMNAVKFLINDWRQTEIQKLKNLHINAEIPELALQSKRRELLIQSLENLK